MDATIRGLERDAALGDPEAVVRLKAARRRSGDLKIEPLPWWGDEPSWPFLVACVHKHTQTHQISASFDQLAKAEKYVARMSIQCTSHEQFRIVRKENWVG